MLLLSSKTQIEISYDKATIRVAKSLPDSFSVVVDIGANNGFILQKLLKVFPHSKCVAFEPIPRFADYLRLKYPKVDVRQLAISNFNGEVPFFNTLSSPALSSLNESRLNLLGETFKTLKIRCDTLDNQLQDSIRVSFIKIDVEGHEIEVLRGAEDTIRKHRPIIVIEVCEETESEVRRILTEQGYRIELLLNSRIRSSLRINRHNNSPEIIEHGKSYLLARI